MSDISKKEKKAMYILMTIMVLVWGFGFTILKSVLEVLDPLNILFYRYLAGFFMIFIAKKIMSPDSGFIRKKDIPLYVVCALVGDVLYFYCEYTAIDYLPISILSIMLAFTPAVSVVIERIVFKKAITGKTIVWILVSVSGIALIIGVDFEVLLEGRLTGYILAFICIITWNMYNFMTAALHERYDTLTLAVNQMLCVLLILLPYAVYTHPGMEVVTHTLVAQVLFLGMVISGVNLIISVRSLHVLGPTTTSLFSNFLPVTTTFFGWLILNETISPIQILGGVIVIVAGYIVIKEKGKAERIVFNKNLR